MNYQEIAKICHEANKSLCETQNDLSQTRWDDAPDWQKESAVNGVKFHLANPDATPENSHENWLKEKLADGWRYGEVKNPDTKEHPCCVPYADLPTSQQSKDYLFRSIIHALAPFLAVETTFDEKENCFV